MTDDPYSQLNLKAWPFNVVPTGASAGVWVGRPEASRKVRQVIRSARRVPASQIYLLWAGFGAGKTHALRHMQAVASEHVDLVTLYVAMPRGIRSFTQIYRAIIDAAIEAGTIAAAGRDLFDRTHGNVRTDFEKAVIRVGSYAEEEWGAALPWLKGEKVPARDLKDIGISQRIETPAHAIAAFDQLVKVLRRDGSVRVLVLMDEVQELEELGRALSECVGGLHKVFDKNAEGVTFVFSFTTASQQALKAIIGDAMYSRAADIVTLPPLTQREGIDFITGLIEEWSIDPARAPWPFEAEAIEAVVEGLAAADVELSPRELIKAFDRVLREADFDIAEGAITQIGKDYALEHAALGSEDDGEG